MKKSKFTEAQIALRGSSPRAVSTIAKVYRKLGISEATF